MAKPADYMLILRPDVTPQQIELLAPVLHQSARPSGNIAQLLWCRAVSEWGSFLHVEAKLTDGGGFAHVRLQSWLVMVIAGEKGSPPIGFLWEEENQQPSQTLAGA